MKGFKMMAFFYAAIAGVPLLLLFIAFTSPLPQLHILRELFLALAGIGSIVYGIISFREVFIHG